MSQSDLPGYDEIFPCEVCGKMVDDCICPECPTCGAQGDPKCYDLTRDGHGLVRTGEQLVSSERVDSFLAEVLKQDRESTAALIRDLHWEQDHAGEISRYLHIS